MNKFERRTLIIMIAWVFFCALMLLVVLKASAGDLPAPERAFALRSKVSMRTHREYRSDVHVVKAPLSMVEALPGCPGYPCGRQRAMLPSVNGARHGAVVSIGGDFVRNGRPVHDFVHNGRVRNRGIRNGDVFMLKDNGTAIIGRGHDHQLHSAEELFGGYPQVLESGSVPHQRGDCTNDDGPDGAFCLRQPRQGIGLSRDGETVILIEVDGTHGSQGVFLPQFGRLFREYGAVDALNVDGGGSAVMWNRKRTRACDSKRPTGCLITKPSYGERRVAQAISVVP